MRDLRFGNALAGARDVDALTTAVASGLRARTETLEMLANNLANAGSSGFKADRESYSTYFSSESLNGPEGSYPTYSPVVDRRWTDFSQGPSVPTGGGTDFAIIGSGFFVVDTQDGPRCTRSGHFRISPSGGLEDMSGHPVRGKHGNSIRLDPAQDFTVDADGVFRQGGQVAGQIEVIDFADRSRLTKSGSTYYRYEQPMSFAVASPRIQQGSLEGANVQPAEAAVRLVGVMRQFEALQKALSLAGEMNRRSLEDVARAKE
ncbi:MAG: flagellar hook basal-body protein [Bryobacterales bacterium]|nr:flagellar hook basal-body protein [Bryobacterales bacterium]